MKNEKWIGITPPSLRSLGMIPGGEKQNNNGKCHEK